MTKRDREPFLTILLSELLAQYPQWTINEHCRINWPGQQRQIYTISDIVIDTPQRRFIIECDEDSDPGRNLIKYWPIIHQNGNTSLTIIEVWKKGASIGPSYAKLAKWIGVRLMGLYPTFVYEFIERKDEKAKIIADKVANIIQS